MAAYGLRPVPEIQFADYIYPGMDQLISEAARLRLSFGRRVHLPDHGAVAVRRRNLRRARRIRSRPKASSRMSSGLKTVIPSNPYDAKGLLIAAIEDPDPVLFFEPKRIYNGPFDGHYDRPVSALVQTRLVRGARGAIIPCRWARRRWCAKAPTVTGAVLRHDGACRARRGRRKRHRWRGDRPAHAGAARRRDDRRVGGEDRTLRDRPRGDADERASVRSCRRRCRSAASTISKPRSSASPVGTRRIPIQPGMGLFSGAGAARPGAHARDEGLIAWLA